MRPTLLQEGPPRRLSLKETILSYICNLPIRSDPMRPTDNLSSLQRKAIMAHQNYRFKTVSQVLNRMTDITNEPDRKREREERRDSYISCLLISELVLVIKIDKLNDDEYMTIAIDVISNIVYSVYIYLYVFDVG